MEENTTKETGSRGGLNYKVILALALGVAVLALALMGVRVSTVSTELDSRTEERDRLVTEKTRLEDEKVALISSNDSIEVERDNLVLENETLTAEKNRLGLERDLVAEEKASLTTERDSLRRELEGAQTQNGTLAQRLANTAERVVSLTGELKETQAQNGVLTQRQASSENRVESLASELDEARDSLVEVISQFSALEDTKKELEAFQDSLQGYWGISADDILTVDIPFTSDFSSLPAIYVYSYEQSDHVFIALEDSSSFTSAENSSLKTVEALTWDETSSSIRFEVDLSKGRAKLSRGTYYMVIFFDFDTEYETVTYLDFTVK